MKKALKYLSMLLVAVLVVTGCGKDNSKNSESNAEKNVSFEEALKNTLENTNMKFSVDATIEISADGNSIDIMDPSKVNFNFSGTVDSKNNVKGTAKVTGISDGETETEYGDLYLDFANKKVYSATYENESDKKEWTVEKLESTDEVKNQLNDTNFLQYVKESKKVDSDKDGYDKYEVSIDLLKALNTTGEDIEDITQVVKIPDITIYMYVKGKYITYISYDLGDVLSESMGQLIALIMTMNQNQASSTSVPKISIVFKGTIELTDQGKVEDIVVPEDIVKNAKDFDSDAFELSGIKQN